MDEILKITNLSKSYGKKTIIDHLNLSIKQGEIYGLLGPNGAGKTTTLKIISKLISPDRGTIEYFGSTSHNQDFKLYEKLSFKTETPYLYDHLTVYQNLELHFQYLKMYQPEKLIDCLNIVKLYHEKDVLVSHLSLGSRQRLAIAKAIASSPSLLLLDEPTNGLDPLGIIDVRNLLKDLAKNKGMTILLSSHVLSEIEQIADKVGIMINGCIIEEIYLDEIRKSNESCIEVIISDAVTVHKILRSKLKIEDISILNENIVHIKDQNLSVQQIIETLACHHIIIKGIYVKPLSLEEYFIRLLEASDIYA